MFQNLKKMNNSVIQEDTSTALNVLKFDHTESNSSPLDQIFLQTKLAQGIAGTFVWIALFLTCQQV